MSAAREKDQADFDLERFVDMFDEALTSRDPRVMDALRGLMMMVTLTRPESRDSGLHDRNSGPLRRMYEDMNQLHRRIERVEEELRQAERSRSKDDYYKYPYEKYTMAAAQNMAQTIDQDILDKLKSSYKTKIQGLK
jgi:hypothetical protein